MKSFFLSIAVFSVVSINCVAQKSISVEDIWSKYAFMAKSAGSFNAMQDGLHYTDIEKEGVIMANRDLCWLSSIQSLVALANPTSSPFENWMPGFIASAVL